MALIQIDPGNTGIIDLFEKFPEISPALMIDKSIFDQSGFKTSFFNPHTEVEVLTETHTGEATGFQEYFSRKAHIKRPGIKFVGFNPASPYAPGRQGCGHRISDG